MVLRDWYELTLAVRKLKRRVDYLFTQLGGGPGGDSIYTSDGTLTSDRNIDLDGHSLAFNDGVTNWLLLDPVNFESSISTGDMAGGASGIAFSADSIGSDVTFNLRANHSGDEVSIIGSGTTQTLDFTALIHTFNIDHSRFVVHDLTSGADWFQVNSNTGNGTITLRAPDESPGTGAGEIQIHNTEDFSEEGVDLIASDGVDLTNVKVRPLNVDITSQYFRILSSISEEEWLRIDTRTGNGSVDLKTPNTADDGFAQISMRNSDDTTPRLALTMAGIAGAASAELRLNDGTITVEYTTIDYATDYSVFYTDRSLVDREFVLNNAGLGNIYSTNGNLAGNRELDLDGNNLAFVNGTPNPIFNPLTIDVTTDAETTALTAHNITGGDNIGAVQVATTATNAQAALSVIFNGFAVAGGISILADTTGVTSLYTASIHNFTGAITQDQLPWQFITNKDAAVVAGEYDLVIADEVRSIELTPGGAANVIVNVPLNATTPISIGTKFEFFNADPNGGFYIKIVPEGGVTIKSHSDFDLIPPGCQATLLKRDTDTWYLYGAFLTD